MTNHSEVEIPLEQLTVQGFMDKVKTMFKHGYMSIHAFKEVRTNLRPDISSFVKFAQAANSPFVALQGRTILRSWVCTTGHISDLIL